jgi:TolB-like protein/Tfp pilus assembly protein PilF
MASPKQDNSSTCSFDDVVVEIDNFRILKGNQAKTLEPRAFDLLIYLIEHRGRVIEKRELFEQVWKRSFVTDSALTQEIKQIRQAIGDNAVAPRYIETIPKRGYRFIAEVDEATSRIKEEAAEHFGVFDSLAVLPFANLNTDPEMEYFVDGITDLLITDLGKIKALKVISRTSAMQYKEVRKPLPQIAGELKVKAVVEGAVLRVGDRVRITIQLIEAATDQHVWAECYERDLRDILSLQNELSETIAEKIHVKLTPEEKARLASHPQVQPEAYEAYLKGNYFLLKFIPGGPQKAIEYFQFAIEKEPNYGAAYAGLADAYGHLGFWGLVPPNEIIPKLKTAVLKALEIDDTSCEAHTVMGKLKFYYELDRLAAEKEFKRAVELNPNDIQASTIYALCLATMGRLDEAMAEIRRTHDLDPLSIPVSAIVGFHLYVLGRWDEGIDEWRKTLEMEPGFLLSHWFLWRVYRLKGMFEEALREFCYLSFMYNSAVISAAEGDYAKSGYRSAMRRAAEKMAEQSADRYVPPMHIAMLYEHAEENDRALEWLERAYEEHDPKLVGVGIEPDWKSLRPSIRFQKLLQRFELPEITSQL